MKAHGAWFENKALEKKAEGKGQKESKFLCFLVQRDGNNYLVEQG